MQVFTVHKARDADAPEAVAFVPDGFAVGAFAFGIFWLLFNRMWVVLGFTLLAIAVLTGIGYGLSLGPLAIWALSVLPNLFLGLEGHQLKRWSLERSGRTAVAVIAARSLDDAEFRYFSGAAQLRPGVQASPLSFGAAQPKPEPVLGLFPEPGGRA